MVGRKYNYEATEFVEFFAELLYIKNIKDSEEWMKAVLGQYFADEDDFNVFLGNVEQVLKECNIISNNTNININITWLKKLISKYFSDAYSYLKRYNDYSLIRRGVSKYIRKKIKEHNKENKEKDIDLNTINLDSVMDALDKEKLIRAVSGERSFKLTGSKKILAQIKREVEQAKVQKNLNNQDDRLARVMYTAKLFAYNNRLFKVINGIKLNNPHKKYPNLDCLMAYMNTIMTEHEDSNPNATFVPLEWLDGVLRYLESKEGKTSRKHLRIGDCLSELGFYSKGNHHIVTSSNKRGYRKLLAQSKLSNDWVDQSMYVKKKLIEQRASLPWQNDELNELINHIFYQPIGLQSQCYDDALDRQERQGKHDFLVYFLGRIQVEEKLPSLINYRLRNGLSWINLFLFYQSENNVSYSKQQLWAKLLLDNSSDKGALSRIKDAISDDEIQSKLFEMCAFEGSVSDKKNVLKAMGYDFGSAAIHRMHQAWKQLQNRNSVLWCNARGVKRGIQLRTLRDMVLHICFSKSSTTHNQRLGRCIEQPKAKDFMSKVTKLMTKLISSDLKKAYHAMNPNKTQSAKVNKRSGPRKTR